MKKMYCLVVTNDYSRFSWVFFLATKDETNGILKSFITVVENLIDQRVKAKAVNTACYVQNMVLVTKPHNKTPYELFLGRKPALGFMRPFGCLVTILNTIDHLGKFDGKADKRFFIGYSINSKAFRVFNSRYRIVEENLHVQFSENTPNVAGSGPNWLFDIDALIESMNYNSWQRLHSATIVDADLPFSQNSKSSPDAGFKPLVDNEKKVTEEPGKEGGDSNNNQEKEDDNVNITNNVNTASDGNSTNNVNVVSSTVNAAGIEVNAVGAKTSIELPDDPNMPELEDIVYSDDDEDVGAEADMNNLNTFMPVSPIPTTRIHKDHPVEQIIGDLNSAPQTRRMTKNLEEHGLFSSVQQRTNHKDFQNCLFACFLSQEEPKKVIHALKDPSWIEAMQDELLQFKLQKMDVKSAFLYGKIEEEVYVCQPPRFEDPDFPDKVYKRGKIDKTLFIRRDKGDVLLVQVYVDDIIFGSTKKSLCTKFEKIMHKMFQMSSMGELTFFLGLQTASTPMETQKLLLKDEDSEKVDVHLYRLMIGSLMYPTSSSIDIMYFKGQPKLGLWYLKDSPFDLVAYTDSDYVGASLDRKSTIRGCQFFRSRLISWQLLGLKDFMMILKLLLLRVNAAGTKLQLLKGYNCLRIKTVEKIKINWISRILT
ncbi:putative ribonuclease H-like domain-containing protein [Tanacetum coccineum]